MNSPQILTSRLRAVPLFLIVACLFSFAGHSPASAGPIQVTATTTMVADLVKEHKVRAIFVESSVSPAAIKRISQDVGAKIGGELFSDAMGTPGQIENGYDLGTYEGMIKHNVNKVVEALK